MLNARSINYRHDEQSHLAHLRGEVDLSTLQPQSQSTMLGKIKACHLI